MVYAGVMSAPAPSALASFTVTEPSGPAGPLVFASPHSGSILPDDLAPAPGLSPVSLHSAEDALVDRLIASGPGHGVPLIAARFSRAYVDLNRAPTELDPTLIAGCPAGAVSAKTAAGFGVIPRRTGDGRAIHDRPLSLAEATARLEKAHTPYHAALGGLMEQARARHGRAVLIDWHSMPSAIAGGPARAPGPDVVLGDRHGGSCDARLSRRLRALFEAAGWRVGLNHPYAGGYSTQAWGRPAEGYQAIQVELSRGLYLDEDSGRPGAGFDHCRRAIDRVIAGLAAESWS